MFKSKIVLKIRFIAVLKIKITTKHVVKLRNSSNNLANSQGFSSEKNSTPIGDKLKSRPDLSSTEISKVNISKEIMHQMTAQAALTISTKVTVVADEAIGTILDIKS